MSGRRASLGTGRHVFCEWHAALVEKPQRAVARDVVGSQKILEFVWGASEVEGDKPPTPPIGRTVGDHPWQGWAAGSDHGADP